MRNTPLGATTDSANHLSYNLRDLKDVSTANMRLIHVPLPEALGMGLDAYMLFDDNTNTGKQALNIIAGWLDKGLLNNNLYN